MITHITGEYIRLYSNRRVNLFVERVTKDAKRYEIRQISITIKITNDNNN